MGQNTKLSLLFHENVSLIFKNIENVTQQQHTHQIIYWFFFNDALKTLPSSRHMGQNTKLSLLFHENVSLIFKNITHCHTVDRNIIIK